MQLLRDNLVNLSFFRWGIDWTGSWLFQQTLWTSSEAEPSGDSAAAPAEPKEPTTEARPAPEPEKAQE